MNHDDLNGALLRALTARLHAQGVAIEFLLGMLLAEQKPDVRETVMAALLGAVASPTGAVVPMVDPTFPADTQARAVEVLEGMLARARAWVPERP